MSLSLLARSIGESATLKLNETAAILRAKGDPVIHLGGGEPKGKAPLDAILAATSLLNSGEVRYTPPDGIIPLKQAIIRYTEEFYHWRPKPENVMASSGAKSAIMAALHALINPTEEVVYPVPYWVSYPDMVRIAGGVPVAVRAEDGSFIPSIRDFEQVMSSNTKLIILNSPNNPSGAVYPRELVEAVVKLAESRGVYLMMDDIYHRLLFDGAQPVSALDYAKDKTDSTKIIIVNGVSKQYAMTGFRIGWAVASSELIRAMTNIQGHESSGPSALLQYAAVGALNGLQSAVNSLRLTLENNRNVLVQELRAFPGVHLDVPGGTFYSFPDFSYYSKDSVKLSKRILDKVQVVTVPGVEFGMEGHLRISFCGSIKEIREGIERMKWVLDPNAPNELYLGDRKLVRDWT